MKGNVIPTRKFASQFNIPEKLIAGGLGPCLNSSPPRNAGMGPREEKRTIAFDSKYRNSFLEAPCKGHKVVIYLTQTNSKRYNERQCADKTDISNSRSNTL
jgi:hypothetical protein